MRITRSSDTGDKACRIAATISRRAAGCAAWIRLLCLSLLTVFLCSCSSVTYDMMQLEHPILLNGNPFLGSPANGSKLVEKDSYAAKVGKSTVTSSQPGFGYQPSRTTTQNTNQNEAQIKAFEKIGGQASLTITDIVLEADSLCVNAGVAIGESVSITATGKVQEVVFGDAVSEKAGGVGE